MNTASARSPRSTHSTRSRGTLLGLATMIIGALMVVAGLGTWVTVSNYLAAERITVAEDAPFLAGDTVNGPFSAFAQASIINEHALASSEGKTYAELDQDDPVRATMMNASFLRASLFTSVVAFGVAAMAIGLGLVNLLVGYALRSTTPAPTAVTDSAGAA